MTRRRCLPLLVAVAAASLVASCDRPAAGPGSRPATGPAGSPGVRIASLSPAATHILVGLGAQDTLVAVSNYDTAPEVKSLPRVGDYQTTDWEGLARLRPDAMVVQVAPERVPAGMRQRAGDLGIRLENVRIDRLRDVYQAMEQLAAIAGRPHDGKKASAALRARLDAVRARCAARGPVRVLLVRDAAGREVIGPDNFLDDLLAVVNATNAAGGLAGAYPSVDRETLAGLRPDVVVVLLPGSPAQVLAEARRFWASLPDLPAVKAGRVHVLADDWVLVPGPALGDLAERLEAATTLRP